MELKGLAFLAAITIVPLSVLGCASSDGTADATGGSEEADSVASTSTFYIVTRPDLRRCAFPACGGVFVRRVNKATSRCADGSYQSECYVAQTDLSAIGLSDDEGAKTDAVIKAGHALVRGALAVSPVAGTKLTAPTLVAREVWVGNALTTPTGGFYEVTDSGIRCIVAPCPHLHEAKLDTSSSRTIADLDLAASGANAKQVAAAQAALAGDGILVAGTHALVHGPAGNGLELVASELYTRLVPAPRTSTCGGIAGLRCAAGQICDVTIQHACNGADLSGTCITKPVVCPQIFAPVCGCDGRTYSNDCFRQVAGVQLDHSGACASAL